MSLEINRSDIDNIAQTDSHQQAVSAEEAEILGKVLQAVRQIKYGYVQITIQDGHVVQIDRTEKQRFNPNK